MKRRWVALVALVLASSACGGDSAEVDASGAPTTRDRFPAAVVPTSTTPGPTTPFGGPAATRATPTTLRRPSAPPAAAATTTTAAPRVRPAATPMPAPRTAVGSTTWRGFVVLAGGFDVSGDVSGRVDSYNPATGVWAQAPSLPRRLHDVALGVLGDDLWAIGGFSVEGDQSVARAETFVFRPGADHWISGPPLETPRGGAAVATLEDTLVVIGGATTDGAALDSVETIARTTSAWADVSPIAHKRAYATALVSGGRVLVMGGRTAGPGTAMRSVESWRRGGWRAEPSLVAPRSDAAAAGACVAGGQNGEGTVVTVECIGGGMWATRFEMAMGRHGLGAGAANGWLHLIGGSPTTDKSVNAAHEVFDLAG